MPVNLSRWNSKGRMAQSDDAIVASGSVVAYGAPGKPGLAFEMRVKTGPRSTERIRLNFEGDDLRELWLGFDRLSRLMASMALPTPEVPPDE